MASTPPSKKARLSPSPAEPTPATPFNATNPDSTNVSQTSAEVAVGITEYVNPTLPSWTGVLKQRYTDFLVNEVDEDGVVVHLKSTRPPRAAPKESKEDVEKKDDRVNSTKAEPVAVAEVCSPQFRCSGMEAR